MIDILGEAQTDVLDSLRASGRMTIRELVDDTGRLHAQVTRAVQSLKRRGLVIDPWLTTVETRAGKRTARQWVITEDGRCALARFEDRGGVPGVPMGAT